MARRGQKLDDREREHIRAFYASCGNIRKTAREFGVSPSTVKRIIDEKKDEVEHLRTLKKSQWIEEAWRTIGLYMERLQDPKVVERTSARDSVIVVGTLQDKILKARELDLKQQEIDLKRQEVETPTENRVVIINDVDEMRKALEEDDSDNGSD